MEKLLSLIIGVVLILSSIIIPCFFAFTWGWDPTFTALYAVFAWLFGSTFIGEAKTTN